jgi:hypothetical protein
VLVVQILLLLITGEAQPDQERLQLEPNVLFHLFYQSWMADTDFSTMDAVCAATDARNDTGTTPVTALSEVDVIDVIDNSTNADGNDDVSSNLAQAAAVNVNVNDDNTSLRNIADGGDIGKWVRHSLRSRVGHSSISKRAKSEGRC